MRSRASTNLLARASTCHISALPKVGIVAFGTAACWHTAGMHAQLPALGSQ